MAAVSLLGLFCLLFLMCTAAELQSADSVIFASVGNTVTLPCGLSSVTSCSSVNWTQHESMAEVVRAGQVRDLYALRFDIQKDCSLKIKHLDIPDARLYYCNTGSLSSSVYLKILQITEKSNSSNGTIELHCSVTTHKGYTACTKSGLNITWMTEEEKHLIGDRFRFENPSECFSKLFITKKLTDHHRRWTCLLKQNHKSEASVSFTTTLEDGLEEVFTVVGESVSLSCGNTSSLSRGNLVKWVKVSHENGQTEELHASKDSALMIKKVSSQHAGTYTCSESRGQQVFNRIRLHTLDVTSESGPDGGNLTLTCVLTCSQKCEKDFTLIWSGSDQNSSQSVLLNVNNALMKRLFLTSTAADDFTCSVQREGEVKASKKLQAAYSLHTFSWIALPLCLLLCVAAGGTYVYKKRKQNKDAGNVQSSIRMSHIYEVMEDENNDKLHQQRRAEREPVTTNDSFYNLLQAVN